MPMFQRTGMREEGLTLPPAFQYLIHMIRRPCDLNLVQNAKTYRSSISIHKTIKKTGIPTLTCYSSKISVFETFALNAQICRISNYADSRSL